MRDFVQREPFQRIHCHPTVRLCCLQAHTASDVTAHVNITGQREMRIGVFDAGQFLRYFDCQAGLPAYFARDLFCWGALGGARNGGKLP